MNGRKIGVAALLALGATVASGDGIAEQPLAKRRSFEIAKVALASTTYTGGALTVEVLLSTWGTTASNATVKLDWGTGNTSTQVALSPVAPGKQALEKLAKLTDPGLASGCQPRTYTISVSNGDAANDASQSWIVTPSCKFTSSIVDEWNQAEPDRVVEREANGVYLDQAAIEAAPTCTAGPKFKATIYNHTKISSPSLIVQASYGTEILAQTTAAFPLAAGASKNVELAAVGRADVPPFLRLVIVDWTHGLGAAVMSHHTVKIDRNCTLTFAKATPPDPPRAIPR